MERVNHSNQITKSAVSFADVAHQMLLFDPSERSAELILKLIDTRWMQRLRNIRQTGNTHLVYMFAEHSRFGHSLGVAYLATLLMKHLSRTSPQQIEPFRDAVSAAALMHDIGHVAPGSHLAERVWAPEQGGQHEEISTRIIREDAEIQGILNQFSPAITELTTKILLDDESLPNWTKAIISGGGWNADRGNWAIVDSAMCSVSYGRYNVSALIDSFRLTPSGELVLLENRLDALTHFFVARDSMYRQVYQHRVLQSVDALTQNIVIRLRDVLGAGDKVDRAKLTFATAKEQFKALDIYTDEAMISAIIAPNYALNMSLEQIFHMTESWWRYHIDHWCNCRDPILKDLSTRLRDRRLLKTVRLSAETTGAGVIKYDEALVAKTQDVARNLGFDPKYYVNIVHDFDKHRGKLEEPPLVLLDSGSVVPVTEVEPLIAKLSERPAALKSWLAVPQEVKSKLGLLR